MTEPTPTESPEEEPDVFVVFPTSSEQVNTIDVFEGLPFSL